MIRTYASQHLPRRILLLLAVAMLHTVAQAAVQPALTDYQARLAPVRAQIPAVVASAQQAADRVLAHPEAQLNLPYWEQMSFAEEMINRAGGLALANTTSGREPTRYDIVLLSVRSWQKESQLIRQRVREYQAKGWTVTVIGSAAGKPRQLGADFFIANGAPSGAAQHSRINVLANVTLGWMWCCEYAAALSRHGKFPAILQSIAMPGAAAYDAKIQTPQGRRTLVDSPRAIPAGELAAAYLRRVDKLMKDLQSAHIQGQLSRAADVVARRLAAGGTVAIAGMGHVQIEEVMVDNKTPLYGFRGVGMVNLTFKAHLRPGDLLIWMSYNGMNSVYDDYARYIAETKVDLITSYAPDPIWAKDPPPTLAHIDQSWALPDAEVPIPVFPNAMAPVSGINVTLLARMLDDEVWARLKMMKVHPKPPVRSLTPEYLDRAGEQYYPYEPDSQAPAPIRKWGFVAATGKLVVPTRYDAAASMTEGLAAVQVKNKWGYLNAAGTMTIAPVYDVALPFNGGTAKVGVNGKFGTIDKTGKAVVPLAYDQIDDPASMFGGFGMNPLYGPVPPPTLATVRQGNRWGLIEKTGKVLLPPTYEAISFFSDKAMVIKQAGKYGLLAITGETLVAPQYEAIDRFRRGYATYQSGGKWGALDSTGKELVPAQYDGIRGVTPDLVIVRSGDKWKGVTPAGVEVFPARYDQVGRFMEGLAQVRSGKLWGVIDATGKEVVPIQYDTIRYSSDGMAAVQRDGKWGYLDKTGALVIATQFDAAGDFVDGVAFVALQGQPQLIDKMGAVLKLPGYDYLANASEGLFKVMRAGKWGFINKTGHEVVALKYSYVLSFNRGRALVALGGQWREDAGKIPLLVGCKWGLIDNTGKEIVPPQYDRIIPYGDGLLAVAHNVRIMMPIP
ncbi:MAG TPA: WG repeat-containing protein [Abditibacteriaceae bacterium]|nr:WG repeat-containing protein [Abditibacteriaceae bacterium]